MTNRLLLPALAGTLLLLVAACTTTSGPLYGPDAPRNGAGEVIDPQTGLVIPGFPQEAP